MPHERPAVIWVLSLLSAVHLVRSCACPFRSLNLQGKPAARKARGPRPTEGPGAAADLVVLTGSCKIHCQEDLETGDVA